MPPISKYYPPGSKERDEGLTEYTETRTRSQVWEQAEKLYNGKHPRPLKVDPDEGIDDNVIINLVRQVVDRSIGFLFPDMPTFKLDKNSNQETPAETYIRETFEENGGILLLANMGYIGALSGHVLVKVLPPDVAAPNPRTKPQFIVINPKNYRIFWKDNNKTEVVFYEITWKSDNNDYLQDIWYNRSERNWVIDDYVRLNVNGSGWVLLQSYVWKSQLSPIIDWQHLNSPGGYYGRGEISDDQIDLNAAINRTASDVSRILRYHAAPRTVGTGMSQDQVIPSGAINSFFTVENPDAKIYNLEMESDLQSSLNFLTYSTDQLLAESRVVIMRGTVKDFQRVTNTGISAVFIDMITKNALLRQTYGNALIEMVKRILFLGGFPVERAKIQWANPLPVDQTELVNVASLERAMNIVSHRTVSTQRGYNWETEQSYMQAEAQLDFLQKDQGSAPIKTQTSDTPS